MYIVPFKQRLSDLILVLEKLVPLKLRFMSLVHDNLVPLHYVLVIEIKLVLEIQFLVTLFIFLNHDFCLEISFSF